MTEVVRIGNAELHLGDCLEVLRTLEGGSVQCCVTSPPYYGLRSYLPDGHADKPLEIGLDPTSDEYVAKLVAVFREVRRVLRDDGTLWLNLGDSYASSGQSGKQSPSSRLGVGCDGSVRRAGGTPGPNPKMIDQVFGRAPTPPGLKPKDLIGIPWRVAFALQADGWWLRQDIIWHKPNPMPESVTDRCTKAHEYLFLLSKSARYFWDQEAMKESAIDAETIKGKRARASDHIQNDSGYDGHRTRVSLMKSQPPRDTRNRRSVWTVATQPYSGAHFATMPPALVEPCVLAGCPVGGTVLDPFSGSGTTAAVATSLGRRAIGIELNAEYLPLAHERISAAQRQPDLFHQEAA